MKQPWIYNAKWDSLFILMPPFFALFLAVVFSSQLNQLQQSYPFVSWLILIVFIDVAHVYSTLFKTYFVKSNFQKHRTLYLGLPLAGFVIALVFYQFGFLVFWSTLALVAVYHFIRQQYGFMRLYSRFEQYRYTKVVDSVTVYAATVYPMLYWFGTPRKFTWFVEDEFNWLQGLTTIIPLLNVFYISVLVIYFSCTLYFTMRDRVFNWPKHAVISGTIISWYVGIVYYNNEVLFTLLNVVSHGIPYMALIYFQEIMQKNNVAFSPLKKSYAFVFILFILITFGLAFSEELLWESLVWKEHFSILDIELSEVALSILVPLLVVPQLTHYLLDGFIWRRSHQ